MAISALNEDTDLQLRRFSGMEFQTFAPSYEKLFLPLSVLGRGNCNATNVAYLMKQNKSFARPSRAFIISVHFFPVLGKSVT